MNTANDAAPISLCYVDRNGDSVNFLLAPGKSVFAGVAKNCSLQLSGADISSIHCRISFDGQSIKVFDWMSASGTFIGGQRIEGEVEVPAGTVLQLGNQTLRILDNGKFNIQPNLSLDDFSTETTNRIPDEEIRVGGVNREKSKLSTVAPCKQVEAVKGQDLTVNSNETASDDFNLDVFELDEVVEQPIQNSTNTRDDPWAQEERTEDPAFSDWIHDSLVELPDQNGYSPFNQDEDQGLVASMESRIRDLLNEAEQSDQRIAVLEDLLLACESAQAAQFEERQCFAAWLQDIERKFGEREAEHLAEVEAVKRMVAEGQVEIQQLHQRLVKASSMPSGHTEVMTTLEELRVSNLRLQDQLRGSQDRCRELEQQVAIADSPRLEDLRMEMAVLAQERAELARQRHELVNQLTLASSVPKQASSEDQEMACRIRTLREHLREIHSQEQTTQSGTSFTARLSNLWHRATR
jgi:pSer/pThr/pTyr-binding forkhead associated (FHA) protein